MEDILKHMDRLDGDIYKLAVMPQDKFDVMNLLKVTDEMSTQLPKPLITMAMSELGEITRVSGEAYGSVMTFANAGKVSAPGQIPLTRMIKSLKDLHESQGEDHD
jgi:3-dehydroquinate dehydratase-1